MRHIAPLVDFSFFFLDSSNGNTHKTDSMFASSSQQNFANYKQNDRLFFSHLQYAANHSMRTLDCVFLGKVLFSIHLHMMLIVSVPFFFTFVCLLLLIYSCCLIQCFCSLLWIDERFPIRVRVRYSLFLGVSFFYSLFSAHFHMQLLLVCVCSFFLRSTLFLFSTVCLIRKVFSLCLAQMILNNVRHRDVSIRFSLTFSKISMTMSLDFGIIFGR